jgi:hypothetical protein
MFMLCLTCLRAVTWPAAPTAQVGWSIPENEAILKEAM